MKMTNIIVAAVLVLFVAGEFEFYCSIGNHRQMGMKGVLRVE